MGSVGGKDWIVESSVQSEHPWASLWHDRQTFAATEGLLPMHACGYLTEIQPDSQLVHRFRWHCMMPFLYGFAFHSRRNAVGASCMDEFPTSASGRFYTVSSDLRPSCLLAASRVPISQVCKCFHWVASFLVSSLGRLSGFKVQLDYRIKHHGRGSISHLLDKSG